MNHSKIPFNRLYQTAALKTLSGLITFLFTLSIAGLSSKMLSSAMQKNTGEVFNISLIFFGIIIGFQAIMYFFNIYKNKKEAINKNNFRIALYERFFRRELSVISKLSSGEINQRFNKDSEMLSYLIADVVPNVVTGIIAGVVYFIYVSGFNLMLGIFILAISIIQIIPPFVVKRYFQETYEEAAEVGEAWMNFVISGHKGLATIKTNNLKKWYIDKFNVINEKNVEVYGRNFKKVGQKQVLNKTINSLLTYGTYALTGFFVFKKMITAEQAVIVVVLCNNFYFNTGNVYNSFSDFFIAKKALKRLEIFAYEENTGYIRFKETENIFEVSRLSFSYGENKVFEDLNLLIPKNKIIGLTGKNGSGKSTLIKLLLGIEKGYTGEIKFHGTDLKSIPEEQLFKSITYIPQNDPEFNISPESILEMISDSVKTDNSLKAELMNEMEIDEKILNASGFSEISGGEKKKISIIGGIMRDSSVIILDEPTNSLDKVSTEKLAKILADLEKTVIIISHNDSFSGLYDITLKIKEKNIHLLKEGEVI